MYKVHFYRNKSGEQPALSYLRELKGKNDKDSRIRARNEYKDLQERGMDDDE